MHATAIALTATRQLVAVRRSTQNLEPAVARRLARRRRMRPQKQKTWMMMSRRNMTKRLKMLRVGSALAIASALCRIYTRSMYFCIAAAFHV